MGMRSGLMEPSSQAWKSPDPAGFAPINGAPLPQSMTTEKGPHRDGDVAGI